MKHSIESRIIAAQPHDRGNKAFVASTLQAVAKAKSSETFGEVLRTTKVNRKEPLFMKFIKVHRALAAAVAVALAISLSFSGYAYASGTNPVALIRKILNGGKTVEVGYDGRTFQYGSKRSYSDAAVTAYAELNTVSALHFRASNVFQIPKKGVEHVSDPFNTKYVYPWVGTVESVDAQTVRVHKQYVTGDKVTPSATVDEHIDLPVARLSSYKQGDPGTLATGDIVMVYADAYLEHQSGSTAKPTSITQYFAFGLTHDLVSIQEAAQNPKSESQDTQAIFEPSWGGATNICLNNGADLCDADKQAAADGESLYALSRSNVGYNNPDTVPFGEAVIDSSGAPQDLMIRNTQGKITAITDTAIVIKSSSGTLWTLDYSKANQQAFGKIHKPLHVGDMLVVSVVASVNDLDNRHFDNKHIYAMQRY